MTQPLEEQSIRIPTHRCVSCQALWRYMNEPECWTLITQSCCELCDNPPTCGNLTFLTIGELKTYLQGKWVVQTETEAAHPPFGLVTMPVLRLPLGGDENQPRVLDPGEFERLKATGMLWELFPTAPPEFPE